MFKRSTNPNVVRLTAEKAVVVGVHSAGEAAEILGTGEGEVEFGAGGLAFNLPRWLRMVN